MSLSQDLERIARAASAYAELQEEVVGVLAAEPQAGERGYLCAFGVGDQRAWLALDDRERPITSRSRVRQLVSIAAMCELAGETAAGGDLDELRTQLVTLALTENPPGIEDAQEAVLALEHAVGAVPRLATPAYLDDVSAATRRLEQALGNGASSPFTLAMRSALQAVEALTHEVETNYKARLA